MNRNCEIKVVRAEWAARFGISSCWIYSHSVSLAQSTSTAFNLFSLETALKVILGVSWLMTLTLYQGAASKDS